MSSKRKVSSLGLDRRVRPRREEEWDMQPESSGDASSSSSVSEHGVGDGSNGQGDGGSTLGSDAESNSDSDSTSQTDAKPKVNLSSVSFGALARAQASMPPSKRKATDAEDATPAAGALKGSSSRSFKNSERKPTTKRSSKHAPQEQTSKRPVSRRREILADPRRQYRDPRFDPLAGQMDAAKSRRAYAFLDDYRDSEMADLRVQIKKTKDEGDKEELKRQLLSMESKKKAQKRKDEAETLLGEHRRHEKELVAQGKQPFYLKKSEQKKQVLTNRFASMSKGQVDRAIERKRKKVSGKEKKELGSLERVRSRHPG